MIHNAQAPPVPSLSAYKKRRPNPYGQARPASKSRKNALFSAIPVEVEFKSEGNGAQEHSQQSKKKIDNIRLLGSFRKDSPSILHH